MQHFLDTRGGPQRVGAICAPMLQDGLGATLSQRRRRSARGVSATRANVAKCGRRGTSSTPKGIRRG
eukprot:7550097-Pyramimonas_sp.AAC.1